MIERVTRAELKEFIDMPGKAFTSEYSSTDFRKALPFIRNGNTVLQQQCRMIVQ